MQNTKEVLLDLFKRKDVASLVFSIWKYVLPPSQQDIVRSILYPGKKRICINAMTRYGKSRCVAIAILLYILLNKNKRVAIIAPVKEQTEILGNYLSELILASPLLMAIVDLSAKEEERLRKESSAKRQTFKNGCEYRVFSAQGEADRLMGFGADGLVIVDEACLIPQIAWAKISRMLGDAPEDTKLIELANPWTRATQYYKDWTGGNFYNIHVGWETALAEGRTTKAFVEEQRQRLTPLEFQVLYESNFPDQSEDSLFSYEKILAATKATFVIKKIENSVIGADVADKGADRTVIIHAYTADDYYTIESIYSEAKSENTAVAGRIIAMHGKYSADLINIDTIGVGVGVVSMVNEGKQFSRCKVVGCHFGSQARDSKRFVNIKAEMYFRLCDLFNNGRIKIPHNEQMIEELLAIRWEYTSAGKIKIIDPDDSPDFADALVYTIWRANGKKSSYSIG